MSKRKFTELTDQMKQAIDFLKEGGMIAVYPGKCRIVDKCFNPVQKINHRIFEKLKPGLRKNRVGYFELIPEGQLIDRVGAGFILYHLRNKFIDDTTTNGKEDNAEGNN